MSSERYFVIEVNSAPERQWSKGAVIQVLILLDKTEYGVRYAE